MTIGWRDAAVPGVLLVAGVVELALLGTSGWLAAAGLEAAAALTLVFRRTHPAVVAPLASLALTAIPYTGTRMDEPAAPILFYIVAIYALGRYASGRTGGLVGLGLLLLLIFADFYVVNSEDNDATDAMFVLALAIPPYLFGRISRRLAQQTELVARQSEQLRDQAVRDERDRIARELHDVIAHSVSAMVVQTAAAQDVVATDPQRAAAMLEVVAETGRKALAETGRLLHAIRDEADELGLRPAPGLADVPALVESFRESGLAVDSDLDLPDEPVPGGVDVSAYRVVREALTNALKHGAGRVALSVATDEGRVTIRCCNPIGGRPGDGSGLGLLGISERVEVLGGTIHHGRNGDGRFELDVVIPWGNWAVTRVVIADDQELVRSGLELVLQTRGCEVVGTAGNGREAVDVVRRTTPDVVLMDIRMPVMDGIAATRELAAAGVPTRILVLTTYDLDRYVYDALAAGAAGFLLKATPPDRLVEGIRTVAAGESLLAPSLTRRLIEAYLDHPRPGSGEPQELRALTERERQVLVLMARGLSNDDIAAQLVVAQATVKTHVNRVLAKLGVTSRVQAVVLAYEAGLVRVG